MVDRDLVTRKLVLILEDLRLLGPVAAHNVDAFLASLVDQAMTERLLERLIGRKIDINYHVLTDRELPPPPDYYQSFVQMGMARLRRTGCAQGVRRGRVRASRCADVRGGATAAG